MPNVRTTQATHHAKLAHAGDPQVLQRRASQMQANLDGTVRVLEDFPDKHTLARDERVGVAAACVLRALRHEAPVYCPPERAKFFVALNNHHFRTLLPLLCLFHAVFLTAVEPPPRLYGKSDAVIDEAGYSTLFAKLADVVVVLVYCAHCFLKTMSREGKLRELLLTPLNVVVFLLFVDMVVNVGTPDYTFRPFRFLRPSVYVLINQRLTELARSVAWTFVPLSSTFGLLIVAQLFYALIGLNLFSGVASATNPLGAACLVEAGQTHPFKNFGGALISMYALNTAANFPDVIWPFYTCDCTFTSTNSSLATFSSGELEWCSTRKGLSVCFFGTFVALVFFCLGNCVLGVCFFFYEKISRADVTEALLRQRLSLITAFYFLDNDNGQVLEPELRDCMERLRTMWNVGETKLQALYKNMDEDGNGFVTIKEFFHLTDLLTTTIIVKREKPRLSLYGRWKSSALRSRIQALVSFTVRDFRVMEVAISGLLLTYALLLALEETRKTEGVELFGNVLVFVFVVEMVLKVLANGFSPFWQSWMNRWDLFLTALSLAGFVFDMADPASRKRFAAALNVSKMLRLLRLLRLLWTDDGDVEDATTLTYYKKLAASLAMTIPVCFDMILILVLYLVTFALMGMEGLSRVNANSKEFPTVNGPIDFTGGNELRYDWSDLGASMWSVVTIILQNGWPRLMDNAITHSNFHVVWFFLFFHFTSFFLILNVIQSLFVFAFATRLNTEQFEVTHEFFVSRRVLQLRNANVKRLWRNPRLEYLMVTNQQLEGEFDKWKVRNRRMSVGTSQMDLNVIVPGAAKRKRRRQSRQESDGNNNSSSKGRGKGGGALGFLSPPLQGVRDRMRRRQASSKRTGEGEREREGERHRRASRRRSEEQNVPGPPPEHELTVLEGPNSQPDRADVSWS